MPISVWGHCNNIVGVTRVHWRIYSKGVVQYIIQRREAPRDILFNPEGVYSGLASNSNVKTGNSMIILINI